MTSSWVWRFVGAGVLLAGLAIQMRATVMAALLCLGIGLVASRLLALVTLIGLVAGAAAGLRIDALAPAGP